MRSTININESLLIKLKNASGILDISTNDMLMLLLNAFQLKGNINIEEIRGIRYQESDPESKWCSHHISYNSRMYEKALDMRRFFKASVSLLVSLAIHQFLDEIIEKYIYPENKKNMLDNYHTNYIIISKMYDYIRGFTVIWGIPDQKYVEKLIE